MTRVMAGEDPQFFVTIRDQFIGEHVKYDLPNCRLIMLPAYTYFAWACYAVDLKENRLTVYDPTLPDDADKEVVSLHVQVCDKIKKALADCAGMFFDGWQYDRAALEIKLLYRKQNMREP